MTSEQFMANFGHIANAPGGVGRLRDLIYHYAFAGELVAHSRETATELAEVLAETVSPTGRTRRAMLEPAAGFYPIPPHWLWVNIGDVGHDWGQTKPAADFTYIDVSAIDNQRGVVADDVSVVSAANAPSRARKVVKKGTIIYSTVRPYLLNIAIINRDFDPAPIASTAFAILHPHDGVEAKFVYYFLRSPAFVAYVESVQSGIAYPAISDQKFFAASFPLAPTAEQKRIVHKVDELMALCDQLEAQQQERERSFPVLSRACHARLAEVPNLANLNRIFDETDSVSPSDLRKSILTLAVHGRLVPQDPTDEPAADSLAAATALDNSSLAKLPPNWIWTRVDDTGRVDLGRQRAPQHHRGPHMRPYLRVQNVYEALIDISDVKEMNFTPAEYETFALRDGDLLLNEGQSRELVGRPAIYRGEVPGACFQNTLVRYRHYDCVTPEYALVVFRHYMRNGRFQEVSKQTTNIAHLSAGRFAALEFPLPPLAEQRRIVAKVDQLMALVDKLEAQQQERDKLAEAFAKVCVASFTGTTQPERPEKMKAPKTELVSLVTLGKKPKPETKAPLAQLLSENKGTLPAKSLWQQSRLTIDDFYQQLKTEIAQGWISPPAEAKMKLMEKA